MRHPTTRRPAPARAPAGKLDHARAARESYERTYKDAPKTWGGTPFDYVTYHRIWRDICATIPRTDAGQQIRLHIHETLRKSLSTLAYVPAPETEDNSTGPTAAELAEVAEMRRDEAIDAGIDAGKVVRFPLIHKSRRRVELDPPPPWTPGPFRRAS
jgi:hypothetical protein